MDANPPVPAPPDPGNATGPASAVVPIVFCFDRPFAPYAAVAIASALCHADAPYRIYCLFAGGLEEFPGEIAVLATRFRCEIVVVPIHPDSFANWRLNKDLHLKAATYYRLLIPELVPEDKVIYLDVDLIVTCGLSELFAIELKGQWIGGCLDSYGARTTRITLQPGEPYVNCGVMLLDTKSLRQHRRMPTVFEYYRENENILLYADQCLINKFTEGHKAIIKGRWNVQFHHIPKSEIASTVEQRDRNAIFHCSGPHKPWMPWCASRLIDLWESYARLTDYDYRKIRQHPATVADLEAMAMKYESEQNIQLAFETWKNISKILLNHLGEAR